MSEDEQWRAVPIEGYAENYEVSNLGRVRSLGRTRKKLIITGQVTDVFYRGRVLRTFRRSQSRDYLAVNLHADGMMKTYAVHTLVLLAFQGPCPAGMQALHGNDVGSDNRASNLRWGFPIENAADRVANGGQLAGDAHPDTKLPDAAVKALRVGEMEPAAAAIAYGVTERHARRVAAGSGRYRR